MMKLPINESCWKEQKNLRMKVRMLSYESMALRPYFYATHFWSQAWSPIPLDCPMGTRHADVPDYRSHTSWKSLLTDATGAKKRDVWVEIYPRSPTFFLRRVPLTDFLRFVDECNVPIEFHEIREMTNPSSLQETVWSIYQLLLQLICALLSS